MKEQIDRVVRDILGNIDRASTINPLLAAAFAELEADGLRTAAELCALLDRWAMDVTLSPNDRAYACQQLDSLPDF
jgi:ribosome assembly protein YihI (activator of Der GTPase)